jgi:sugar O-acyltransferase (sialic acid O-acetyltransferase NeuD family)
MPPTQIAIYGAGGFGREVAWLAQSCSSRQAQYEVVCFVDDDNEMSGSVINDIPVITLEGTRVRYPDARLVSGIGSPQTRQLLMEKGAAAGFGFATLIHPNVEHSEWIEFGPGTVVCAGNVLTTNIVIGQHVQINLDCTIGHDVVLGDYATLAPGVHVSGWVHVGDRVYIGTGATIINGTQEKPLVIGDDVVVGAGACVVRSVPPGLTVVGVPAKPLDRAR